MAAEQSNADDVWDEPQEHSEITEEELEQIERLREYVGDDADTYFTQDDFLRVVRGYLHETGNIRWEHMCAGVDTYRDDFLKPGYPTKPFPQRGTQEREVYDDLQNRYLCCVYGQDKQGHPIIWENLSRMDAEGLAKENDSIDKVFKYRSHLIMGAIHTKNKESAKKRNKQIYKYCHIIDVNGIGLWNARQYLGMSQAVIDRGATTYCEMVYKIIFVNAGWSFTGLWKLAQLFINPVTSKKITIVGSGYKKDLERIISPDQIPQSYGGTNPEPIEWGVMAKFFPPETN